MLGARGGVNVVSKDREGRWREEGPRALGDVGGEIDANGRPERGAIVVASGSAEA